LVLGRTTVDGPGGVQDHYRAMVDGQTAEAALELVAIDDRAQAIPDRRLARYPFNRSWPGRPHCSSAKKEDRVLAVTFLGFSISGRELLIIAAVVVVIIMIGIVLAQRRTPR
jgi:hypothetical protein